MLVGGGVGGIRHDMEGQTKAIIVPQRGRGYNGMGLQVTRPTQVLEGQKAFPEVLGFKLRHEG